MHVDVRNKQAAAAALIAKRIQAARVDFAAFVKFVWSNDPDFQLADFHYEAIAAYTNPALKFVYWSAPRGHAKSMLTIAYAVFALGQDINHRIKIFCANDPEAIKRLREIKEQIEKNPMLRLVFPRLKPSRGEWNKHSVVLERDIIMRDPSIQAMGITSGGLGSRATLIIADDIVDMRNSILQPELKRHIQQKLFGEIIPTLEPEGRFLAVGTPWTLTDVNALMQEAEGFYVVGPHFVGQGDGKDADLFKPIWEYKQPREILKGMYDILGPAEYARAYRCKALTGDTVPIQQQWIQFYNSKILGNPDEYYCLNIYDLAIEQTVKNDYFARIVLLWDKARNFVFVADASMQRISFQTQADTVINTAKEWVPNDIVIEHGAYQGALASYLEENTEISLPLWAFKSRGRSKERRVAEITPWFENMRVYFHPKFDPRANPDINMQCPIVQQAVSFPFDKFDDLIDALSMGLLVITELAPENKGKSASDTAGFSDFGGGNSRVMVL